MTDELGAAAKLTLESLGVLGLTRRVRRRLWLTFDQELRRRDQRYRRGLQAFTQANAASLRDPLNAGTKRGGAPALIIGRQYPTIESELAIIKSLQLAGFMPVVLLRDSDRGLRPYYALAGVAGAPTMSEFAVNRTDSEARAVAAMAPCRDLDDVLGFEREGVCVGRIAVSTAIRQLRVGTFDLESPAHRRELSRRIAFSMQSIDEAENVLDTISPELVVFHDTEYSPVAEIFDLCINRGVDVVAYDVGPRTNSLVFKRYTAANKRDHLSTLSAATWAFVQRLEWTDQHRKALARELAYGYASGDWYRSCWTQAHTHAVGPEEIRQRLGLRSDRKSAFVFAHILWDAPVSWGRTLFSTYEEWLVHTVKAACRNENLDWVIKIHPANRGKRAQQGYLDEPAEMRVIRERIGPLPSHIRLLDPSFDVSTQSLFDIMDYCVTVRGTVGIEAARLGIPVVTAGEGRYAFRGFTIDSETPEAYIARLEGIHDTPPLDDRQRNLAERFAYAFFVLKPTQMTSVTWDFRNLGDKSVAAIHVTDAEGWRRAADITSLGEWLGDSADEDLLRPHDIPSSNQALQSVQ